ncbi:MAG: hypothetical protein FWD64_03415 [Acidobacteriaceae bacterium]|nr:hypothetical protein [Acidobacteriaceae bacterium]
MRRLRFSGYLVSWLAFVLLAGSSFLPAQTIKVQHSSRLSFVLSDPFSFRHQGSLVPGGNMEVTVTCTPGLKPCPKEIAIYASVDQCVLRSQSNPTTVIPASRVQAQINKGSVRLFNQLVPPDREGCGLTLYTGPMPTSQTISVSAAMFIDTRQYNAPIGIFQGSLNIHVDTF